MKKIFNEKILEVYNWSKVLDPKTINPFESYVDEYGEKVCSVFLPLINKTIMGYGKNELERIINLANDGANEIAYYLSNHPECKIKTIYSLKTHEIIFEEEIDQIFIKLNEEEIFNKELNRNKQKSVLKRAFIKKFFEDYKSKFSQDDGLFLQLIERDVFPDSMDDKEIHNYLIDSILEMFDSDAREINVHQDENHILVTARILLEPSKIVNWRKRQ